MFITTARRGQNAANHSTDVVNPSLTTQGIGRALVWVFNPANLGTNLEGNPVSVITLFGDTPRALAVSPDGTSVYAAVFHSGNRTTTINEGAVCDGGATAPPCGSSPGGLPAPNVNFEGTPGPEVGLIVKFNPLSGTWQDELGRNWPVPFSLPDFDVFRISTATLTQTASFSGVGTILFDMVANPVNGKVYVSNTEAVNEVRFEGPGNFVRDNNLKPPGEPASVIGHLHEARVTVLDGTSVIPRHLNKHIDYDVVPSLPGVAGNSLATPMQMAVTSDGATLYLAAFGSSKVGVFSTAALENDTFVPSAGSHIAVTGGGPSGLVLDETNDQLYVLTRFDNSISVIDTNTSTEVDHVPIYNPEPANVVDGRRFLYDASFTSSNGEASCSSCHVFGDFDGLAWDLGDPDGTVVPNTNPFQLATGNPFHPMKGPMTTQSLRGMANHGPMHWRGDRTGGGAQALDESLAFNAFNPAFVGLIGRAAQLTPAEMQAFTDFILDVTYPPNPIRNLDNSPTTPQSDGRHAVPRASHRHRVQLRRLPRARSGERILRRRRRLVDRGRDAGVQDPASAQRVSEGRHVRQRRQPGARFRFPARRLGADGLQLPQRRRVLSQQYRAAQSRGVRPSLPDDLCADRRPADDAHEHQRRRRRRAHQSVHRPRADGL